MRAMVLKAPAPVETGPLVLEERRPPDPGPGQILIAVSACGVCRTDLHIVEGELPLVRSPLVPGHQIVGRVVGAGPGAGRFAPGARVGVGWLARTCGACAFCASGRENLCEAALCTGYHADGGYADRAVAFEAFAYAIPPAFEDAEAAPLLCAGIIGYRALTLAAVPPGGRLALYGFGSSAHLTLQVAVARGLEVYVATRSPAHQALARRLGAAWAADATERLPRPADGIVIFAPAGELVPLALRNLAPGGTLALAGIHMSPIPTLAYADLYRERVIRTVTANTRADAEAFLAEAARVPVRPAVTRFALEDANRALADLRRGALAGSGVLVPGPL
ncbi:MAG TPA: zinc-dependent alcohol dehydrogenase family protein [Candidatus Binatia bacterium]|nr:zinc-dependent alcohol dehydrogenase family protein [Candidatus Binatia bacterium]